MSVSAHRNIARISGTWNAPERVLRLEKPGKSAAFGEERDALRERRGPKPTRRQAYRFDTVPVSPWNGPVLTSAYAAQVIAQALHAPGPALPHTAYPAPRTAVALLLDEIL